jgi:hypothetical protein
MNGKMKIYKKSEGLRLIFYQSSMVRIYILFYITINNFITNFLLC